MTVRKRSTSILLAAAALASGGATECGEILDDSGFELWCGDQLCAWQLEKGAIRRAPTWHADDSGVELVGDDVAIAQLTPVERSDGDCVRFTLVADVAETAEVTLELDVYGDGTVEHQERIPTSDWRRLAFLVRMPSAYEGVRFRLSKRGAGRAVLANIGAAIADSAACPGAAIPAGVRPLGARCTGDAECGSGLCDGDAEVQPGVTWPGTCAGCDADADCAAGQLCAAVGTNLGPLEVARRCVAAGAAPLGAGCARDAECATGICVGAVCSGCRADADCGGRACAEQVYQTDATSWPGPRVCGPGGGPGTPCLTDAGCASGTCGGPTPLRVCLLSARECAAETDCPTFGEDGLESCVTVGTRGGSCQ